MPELWKKQLKDLESYTNIIGHLVGQLSRKTQIPIEKFYLDFAKAVINLRKDLEKIKEQK